LQQAHQQQSQEGKQQPLAELANLTGSAQQQQQQQQRRHVSVQPPSLASCSSDDEASWHLDLSQYGSYLEQEHAGVKHGGLPERADSGITWQQLQQGVCKHSVYSIACMQELGMWVWYVCVGGVGDWCWCWHGVIG
jgi:hypothetical protein